MPDDPASSGPTALAKVVMAELTGLKLGNKPWPAGKVCHLLDQLGGTGQEHPACRRVRLQTGNLVDCLRRGDSARVGETEARASEECQAASPT